MMGFVWLKYSHWGWGRGILHRDGSRLQLAVDPLRFALGAYYCGRGTLKIYTGPFTLYVRRPVIRRLDVAGIL